MDAVDENVDFFVVEGYQTLDISTFWLGGTIPPDNIVKLVAVG